MRRQNRSCDQCRKAKRGCDAPLVGQVKLGQRSADRNATLAPTGEQSTSKVQPNVEACSYCRRTKKNCTFHWLRSQIERSASISDTRSNSISSGSGSSNGSNGGGGSSGADAVGLTGHPDSQHTPSQAAPSAHTASDSGFNHPATWADFMHLPQPSQPPSWDAIAADDFGDLAMFGSEPLDPAPNHFGLPSNNDPLFGLDVLDTLMHPSSAMFGVPTQSPGCLSQPNRSPTSVDDVQAQGAAQPASERSFGTASPHGSCLSVDKRPGPRSRRLSSNKGPASRAGGRRRLSGNSQDFDVSPFSLGERLLRRTNNGIISENLMGIYHDVLENALTCWVTEETCPYKMQLDSPSRAQSSMPWATPTLLSEIQSSETPQSERGPMWSNRIYRRVIKLDKAAQSSGITRLTRAEDRAVSRAFHLSIMAFASQWAQASARGRERYDQAAMQVPGYRSRCADGFTEEFDRTIQRSFWAQARNALQECADVESFRVACAELIFGLTQKPLEEDDLSPGGSGSSSERNGNGDVPSFLEEVSGIISNDGPPMFLERAARKLHVMKFQFECHAMGLADGHLGNEAGKEAPSTNGLDAEDRQTIGLLYWLALMTDTVSSAMTQRPLAVSDEECRRETAYHIIEQDCSCRGGSSWWDELFAIQERDPTVESLRWPCSYEVTAKAITNAAPLKVLLFRHVALLQRLVIRKACDDAIERSIRDVTLLYRFWNTRYGPLFHDLVTHYDAVPQRLQSWFVCIAAHWHFATLILADLIEFVDNRGLGTDSAKESRLGANVVQRLRRANAKALSDLAGVATPRDTEPGTPQGRPALDDFHPAVSEGSVLTEPWTMILIRAFTKTAILLLQEAQLSQGDEDLGYGRGALQDAAMRSEMCIRALWWLGKKSDMARLLAGILARALASANTAQPFTYHADV